MRSKCVLKKNTKNTNSNPRTQTQKFKLKKKKKPIKALVQTQISTDPTLAKSSSNRRSKNSPILILIHYYHYSSSFISSSITNNNNNNNNKIPVLPSPWTAPTPTRDSDLLVSSFKDWFNRRNNSLLDQIFLILNTQQLHNDSDDLASRRSADLSLSQLNLRLSESFVLDVLNYGKGRGNHVLSSLKFFDWVGRQPGFHHTRATFHAIFKILSKAQLMSLLLDFLHDYMKQRYLHKVRFWGLDWRRSGFELML